MADSKRSDPPSSTPRQLIPASPGGFTLGPAGLFVIACLGVALFWLPFVRWLRPPPPRAEEETDRSRAESPVHRARPPRSFEADLPGGPGTRALRPLGSALHGAKHPGESRTGSPRSGSGAPGVGPAATGAPDGGTGEEELALEQATREAAAEEEAQEVLEQATREYRSALRLLEQELARAVAQRRNLEGEAEELEQRAMQAVRAAELVAQENPQGQRLLEEARAAEEQAQDRAEDLRARASASETQARARAERLRQEAEDLLRQAESEADRIREAARRQ